VADKAVAMILLPQAAVRVVVRKAARPEGVQVMLVARRAARLAVAPRVAVRLVVDRRAVDRKAAAQAAVRLAAVKDLAAHLLVSQCQAAAGFQVFQVLAPAAPPVAVAMAASQAAARPRAAVVLRAVHRMKAFSEDRAAAVVPPALLVVRRAAKAVKQAAVRPAVLLDRWAVAPKAAWQAAERPVVLLARWAAQAIQVAVCPAVPVNPEVRAKQAEVAAMLVVPAALPALVLATAATPAGALAAARVAQVR
jgi:hypothetical protein